MLIRAGWSWSLGRADSPGAAKVKVHRARQKLLALRLARDAPGRFTASMAKAQRRGKVYVDYLRNVRGAHAVGAFSTRARAGAPVSVPVGWDELDRLSGATDLTVAEVPRRLLVSPPGSPGDPWAEYRSLAQRVPPSLTRDLAG